MKYLTILNSACLSLLLITGVSTQADIIKVPVGAQGEAHRAELPKTAMSMEDVEAKYGMPTSKTQPVGEPPISRWVYEDFYVYFEYSHVIRAVYKHKPKGKAAKLKPTPTL